MGDNIQLHINDIKKENLDILKTIFPSVFIEGTINFELLKEELGVFKEDNKEKYEFTWAGKQEAKKKVQENIGIRTLKYIEKDSKNSDKTQNLYVEGDNLEVLKLLRQNYYSSVDVIYIDPPYNTGKDFVYKDNFTQDVKSSDIKEGIRDDEGKRLEQNPKSSNRYHATWLNMIYPRLKVARDLLKDDGVIFISISDNEQENLKKICNEIFGEENFIANLVWTNKEGGGSSDSKHFRIKHEYILVYGKIKELVCISGLDVEDSDRYKFEDEYVETRGRYQLIKLDSASLGYVQSLDYPITAPDGTEILPNKDERKISRWRWGKEKLDWGIKNDFVVIKKDSKNEWAVYTKQYLNCDNEGNIKPRTLQPIGVIDKFSTTQSNKKLGELIGKNIFNYSKPVDLIKLILQISTTKNSLILDFFSGSATTAHAVMELNSEDGGNRKFIMVQVPELSYEAKKDKDGNYVIDKGTGLPEVQKDSEARKNGFNYITEIGKERIRRAGEKIKLDKNLLGENLDIGFKVLKVSDTNINWKKLKEITRSTALTFDEPDLLDFVLGSNDIDIVYEVLLRQRDLPLSEKLVKLTDIGDRTYLYADSYLICLETKITRELVECLAELNPLPVKFVFRDSAFGSQIGLKEETFRYLKTLIEKNLGITKKSYTVEFI